MFGFNLKSLKVIILFSLFFSLSSNLTFSADKKAGGPDKVIYPRQEAEYNRFADLIEMLKMALDITVDTYGPYELKPSAEVLSERRIRKEIKKGSGRVTIDFNTPTKKNVEDALPVNFPPRKGILGYRLFIIHKKDIEKFKNIKTIDDIKKLRVLQGQGWNDVNVFRENGIEVVEGSNYEGLFGIINKGRVDYFSRGITEIFGEVESRKEKYKNLAIDKFIVLYYDWPYYYMLNKKNHRLKERLEAGLEMMVKDGSRDKHFEKWYGSYIKRGNLKGRTYIKLKHSLIWEGVPLHRKELWYNPEF